jgi:undecaprenyl diphosphate synthase
MQIPTKVALGIQKLVEETKNGDQMVMNICLSYGSRGEIVNACKDIAKDVTNGVMSLNDISEASFQRKLLTWNCPDPDLVIRTSGEYRLSNFLLWQIAYSEMFFLNKTWPEVTKEDFLCVIRQYARERKRRFGK